MHLAASRRDDEVAVPEAADEVEGFLRWLLQREPKRIVLDVALHGFADVRRRLKEAIGGHEAFETLVRTLEIVSVDKKAEAPHAVGVVGKNCPREELVP